MNNSKVKSLSSIKKFWEYLKYGMGGVLPKQNIYEIDSQVINYDPETTLVVQARHGFGDNLMVTAVLGGVHREYPEKNIVVLAKNPTIFFNNPDISVCCNIKNLSKGHPLRRVAFDLEYVNLDDRRQKKRPTSTYIDELYECLPFPVTFRCYKPKLILTEQEHSYRHEELKGLPRPLVAIAPYGKKDSPIPSKIYPKDKWVKIVELLRENGVSLLQIGVRSEGPLLPGVWDWMDLGYRNTAAVLYHTNAVVTHPGGIMHLATALDVPCITLFGGIEDPTVSGYGQNNNLCAVFECVPCWRKRLCNNPVCMDQLTPEKIVKETLQTIKEK
jgi:ADP-heptose:LPS heptosyltransferase